MASAWPLELLASRSGRKAVMPRPTNGTVAAALMKSRRVEMTVAPVSKVVAVSLACWPPKTTQAVGSCSICPWHRAASSPMHSDHRHGVLAAVFQEVLAGGGPFVWTALAQTSRANAVIAAPPSAISSPSYDISGHEYRQHGLDRIAAVECRMVRICPHHLEQIEKPGLQGQEGLSHVRQSLGQLADAAALEGGVDDNAPLLS